PITSNNSGSKSQRKAQPLRVVLAALAQREGKIECDGGPVEDGQDQPDTEPDAGADCTEFGLALNGSGVGEDHAAEVIAVQREAQLGRAGDGEIAADRVIIRPGARADAAELEAAHGPDPAGVETLEERRGSPDPTGVA